MKNSLLMDLKKLYSYYKTHHQQLYKDHANEFLVITEKENEISVVYHDASKEVAYEWAIKNIGLGEFILQQATADTPVWQFHSRVAF